MPLGTDHVTEPHSWKWGLWLPFVLGLLSPIVIYRALVLFGVERLGFIVALGALVFGASAVFASSRLPGRSWSIAMLIYAGIPVGTLIDVAVGWFAFSSDRNLFPLEILLWWAVAAIPVFLGIYLARSSGAGLA